MQASNAIAVYNATRKQLVEDAIGAHNWNTEEDAVYVLMDYAFVDADTLADYTHEDFIEDGWEKQ